MEANVHRVYKYLERKYGKIKVEYEPKGFKFDTNSFNIRYYIPDFKISAGKVVWYVEVKGRVTSNTLQKDTLVSKSYPGVKLFYITPVEYEKIKSCYKHFIKNWE